ncbi:GntR family transcriptional regulator [Kocuria sp. M1R5S2]|uniref:GntR family transcriptional regulator n=1 Tax=Kocuria rhizosphaerae TaxID=3376285 RepID=UPI00378AF8F6
MVSYAHQQLRDAILSNAIPADTTLSQVQLAKQLGLSRTPLREALRLLEHEGLATVEVNKKVTVANVSPEDLDALYALRIQQESLAIFAAVRAFDPENVDRAREHLTGMEDAVNGQDYEQWAQHHRVFHMSLVAGVNDRFTRSIQQHFDHADRYRRIYLSESQTNWGRSMVEHRSILDAVLSRKPAEAAELLARHYSHTARGVLTAIDGDYTPDLMNAAVTMALSLRFQQ